MPVVGCCEVATWIAEDGDVKGLEGFNHVFPEVVRLDEEVLVWVLWVVNAACYAAAHMLKETGIDISGDRVQTIMWEDCD